LRGDEAVDLSPQRLLAWRMRRQLLGRPMGTSTLDIVARRCGVPAEIEAEAGWIEAVTGAALTVAIQ
jgi:hypothetical protein